ncbi:60S ribosomal protein L11 [Mycena rebaudengoi]|nr:60S ribosomal protein L11 [Mycena rebaudengoi]
MGLRSSRRAGIVPEDLLTRASKATGPRAHLARYLQGALHHTHTFGIRHNEKSVHITIRGHKVEESLERKTAYIDLGARYDSGIGIFGLDFYVVVMGHLAERLASAEDAHRPYQAGKYDGVI